MTIKLTLNATRPVVKTTNPELYVDHTFHMSKARKHTYNYSPIDDYIMHNWKYSTIAAMANELNEYDQRVAYRIVVLKSAGLIRGKYNTERGKLNKQYKVLLSELLEVKRKIMEVA